MTVYGLIQLSYLPLLQPWIKREGHSYFNGKTVQNKSCLLFSLSLPSLFLTPHLSPFHVTQLHTR